MPEKLGTENLAFIEKTLVDTFMEVEKDLEDGHISVGEGVGLIDNAIAVFRSIKKGKAAVAEFKDLDEAEIQERYAAFKDRLDLKNDATEALAEELYLAFLKLSEVFNMVLELKAGHPVDDDVDIPNITP